MVRAAFALAAIVSLGLTAPAIAKAAPCKDPKTGKFTKCPPAKPAPAARCKDAKGRFAKCGTPGASPIGTK